jgi:hypothetical protein
MIRLIRYHDLVMWAVALGPWRSHPRILQVLISLRIIHMEQLLPQRGRHHALIIIKRALSHTGVAVDRRCVELGD